MKGNGFNLVLNEMLFVRWNKHDDKDPLRLVEKKMIKKSDCEYVLCITKILH